MQYTTPIAKQSTASNPKCHVYHQRLRDSVTVCTIQFVLSLNVTLLRISGGAEVTEWTASDAVVFVKAKSVTCSGG